MEKKQCTIHLEVTSDLGTGHSIGADLTINDLLVENIDGFAAQVDAAATPFCEAVAKELYAQILGEFAILRMAD